jgi:hypothetical protein
VANDEIAMKEHWFWGLLMLAVLVWYSIITIYVAVRGCFDIRDMFRRLQDRHSDRMM